MLLQDELTLFVLPILLFIAIVTRTLVQGFGVLFAIFICVFVIPTPFVRPPGPLSSRHPRRVALRRHAMAGHDARQAGVRSFSSRSGSGWCIGADASRPRAS